jgi:hypothetical protein
MLPRLVFLSMGRAGMRTYILGKFWQPCPKKGQGKSQAPLQRVGDGWSLAWSGMDEPVNMPSNLPRLCRESSTSSTSYSSWLSISTQGGSGCVLYGIFDSLYGSKKVT